MKDESLLSETLALTKGTSIPVTKICNDLGLTTRWYYKLTSGQIKDPGVKRIQRLHDYLHQEII
jgi:hypothetical protein